MNYITYQNHINSLKSVINARIQLLNSISDSSINFYCIYLDVIDLHISSVSSQLTDDTTANSDKLAFLNGLSTDIYFFHKNRNKTIENGKNPTVSDYLALYTALKTHLDAALISLQIEQSIIPLTLTKSKAKAMTNAKAKRLNQLKALKQWLVYQAEPKKTLGKNVYSARVYHPAITSNSRKNHLNEA